MPIIAVRWLLLLIVGLPVQALVYVIYPILWLIWRLFIYKKITIQKIPLHEESTSREPETRINGLLLNNSDDHGALTMYGFIEKEGLAMLLNKDGDFSRRVEDDGTLNMKQVSGDCVATWAFAFMFCEKDPQTIKKAVDNYVLHLGTRSFDEINKGWVSARCNNLGVNYCPDAWMRIGQPCAGPQFYTTSCLLALAYSYGLKYKLLFWSHWVLLGGWYWAFWPMLNTKNQPLNYAKDISMKALYIHLREFGPRWWIIKPMIFINYKMSEYRNDLWCAMLGQKPLDSFPEVAEPFFSQRGDAASVKIDQGSRYIKKALYKIYS
jgi:hypothetical protein